MEHSDYQNEVTMYKSSRTRTQRILDLTKDLNCNQNVDTNNVLGTDQNERPVLKDISNSETLESNSEDIPAKHGNHTINVLSNVLVQSGTKSNPDEELKKNKDSCSKLDSSSSSSSDSSSSDSSSSDSDSDSSSKSNSSNNSVSEPYETDDSLKDPTFKSPVLTNQSNYSSDDEEDNVLLKNEKRKVSDPCDTEKIGKKRIKNIDNWKKNVAKRLRNSGESYVSASIRKNQDGTKTLSKVTRPAKSLLPPCGLKCKLKCSEKITLDERTNIFDEYWKLKEVEKQREFISSNLETINPKYKYSNSEKPRNPNNAYYFCVQQNKVRVCKYFFMATLAINHRVISTILKKRLVCVSSKVVEIDKRGKHGKHKRLDENIKNGVRTHINSIPRVESHYCRSHSTKEYIEGDKTIADLHRDYTASCKEQNLNFANYFMYSKIFNEEFNLAFNLPKKDQCELCLQYRNSNDQQKEEIEEKYSKHVKEKELSRKIKEEDKKGDAKTKVIVFDLQAVLPCPTGEAASFYYVSKLNVLNFTLYDIKSNEGTCFLWHEGEAHRGANEIGSCILKYLREMAQQTQEDFNVVFYSDNCAGQNKNKFVIAMYMYAVFSLGITSITHNFFVTGHGQSEGDSMHAMIEKQIRKFKKSSPIYAPDQYACIIRSAKKNGKPYTVNELCYSDFVDLKALTADLFINIPKNVKLTEIRAFKLEKNRPNVLFYKTSFDQNDYDEALLVNTRKKNDWSNCVLKKAYSKKPGITEAKKNGLLSLIQKKRCVPMYYLDFYQNL